MKPPKISVQNLYYMLCYAVQEPEWLADTDVQFTPFDNIYEFFADVLSKRIGMQLKTGLYRRYIDRSESLPVLRGKLDIPGTMRNRIAQKQKLACDFDELSVNTLLNQILKTAVLLLLRRKDVSDERKGVLRREMMFFSEIEVIAEPSRISWDRILYHRNNQSYRFMMHICRLILEGLLITDKKGKHKLASLKKRKAKATLYEKFIRSYFAYHYQGSGMTSNDPWISWASSKGAPPLTSLPGMHTDICLHCKKSRRLLIIDAKFYSRIYAKNQYEQQRFRSAHLYQIFSYTQNAAASKEYEGYSISCMLLYAQTSEKPPVEKPYMLSGNHELSLRTLDLAGDFKSIAIKLDKIVQEYFPEIKKTKEVSYAI